MSITDELRKKISKEKEDYTKELKKGIDIDWLAEDTDNSRSIFAFYKLVDLLENHYLDNIDRGYNDHEFFMEYLPKMLAHKDLIKSMRTAWYDYLCSEEYLSLMEDIRDIEYFVEDFCKGYLD